MKWQHQTRSNTIAASENIYCKLNYFYILTPKGIAEKAKLTLDFMQRKMKEYDELKKEVE